MMRAALAAGQSADWCLVTSTTIPPQLERRKVALPDSSTTDRLPQLNRAERADLFAARRAIPRVDTRTAELGQLYLAAESAWMADMTPENHRRMIEAEHNYKARQDEVERAVTRYVRVERTVIRSARARESRLLVAAPPLRRRACRRVGQRRSHRSHRTVAKPTVGGDSGDSDGEPPRRRSPRARGPPVRVG